MTLRLSAPTFRHLSRRRGLTTDARHPARNRRLGRRAHDRRCGWQRRLGRLRSGRAAQPPHPREHRDRKRGRAAACWSIPRPICETSFWPIACRHLTPILYTHAHADHITGLDDVRILNRIAGPAAGGVRHARNAGRADPPLRLRVQTLGPAGILSAGAGAPPVSPGDTFESAGLTVRVFRPGPWVLGNRWGCGQAASPTRPTWLPWTTRRSPCWRASIPGSSAASCAGARTRRTRISGWCWNGPSACAPRRMVLTHMGTDMDWAWLRAHLPPGVEPGYDGMVLDVAGG